MAASWLAETDFPTLSAMLINADFSKRAAVSPKDREWVSSPQDGVQRVMLDRVGSEKGRATSLVRYAAESQFPAHMHPGGEEILVLEGVFSADGVDYPAGWYLRNPPGSRHQPFSGPGALIFVKLWQMDERDWSHVRVDTRDASRWGQENGRCSCRLFSNAAEHVSIMRIAAGESLCTTYVQGLEALVLEGSLEEAGLLERGSWLRLPPGEYPNVVGGSDGATVYLKTGHLPCHRDWRGGE